MLIASLLLLSSVAAVPASAIEYLQPVAPQNLNAFIGRNLFGEGYANLGVVSAVDPYAGVIGLTGTHGEFALISSSMLARNGLTLRAPTLTAGDVKIASDANFAHPGAMIATPHIIIVEPPPG
jgi:hypothetical protein